MKQVIKSIVLYSILILVSLLVAIGLLVTLELGYRKVVKAPTGWMIDLALFWYQPFVVTTIRPNLVLGNSTNPLEVAFRHTDCDEEGGITCRINSRGFRSPEFDNLPPKRADEFRIVITGASTAQSWNIGEKCTMDRQLVRILEPLFPELDIQIYNLAGPAWKSIQELIGIIIYGIDIDPDLVIAYDGFNDVNHSFSYPINTPIGNWHMFAAGKYEVWLTGGIRAFFNEFKILHDAKRIMATQLAQVDKTEQYPQFAEKPESGHLATRLDSVPVDLEAIAARTDFDPYNREVVDNYLKNIRTMAQILSMIDAHLIVALSPSIYTKNPLSPEEEKKLRQFYVAETNFCAQGYVRIREGMQKISTTTPNIRFDDLSLVVNDERRLMSDNGHLTPLGTEMVSAHLTETIAQLIREVKPAQGLPSKATGKK